MNVGLLYCVCILLCCLGASDSVNKYSQQANTLSQENAQSVRSLDKPFRMAKLNLLWAKAKLRLTEPKLKSLFTDLKLHDKEEITFKSLRSEGHDKDGIKEAALRRKLISLMTTYGLNEYFDETQGDGVKKKDPSYKDDSYKYINKSLFKDKKLNQLWVKAESAGFTTAELEALKEEFEHHQEKIDQYYSLLSDVEKRDDYAENTVEEKLDKFNMLNDMVDDKNNGQKLEKLRSAHQEIRDGYDRLHRVAAKGPNSKEFIEPKVQGLWMMAKEAKFADDELESLRTELLHYENRLLKLRHFYAESHLNADVRAAKLAGENPPEGIVKLKDNIKKQERKVEKMHLDIETRIMQKHIEL